MYGVLTMLAAAIGLLLLLGATLGTDECPASSLSAQQIGQRVAEINTEAGAEVQRKEFAQAALLYADAVCLTPNDPQEHYFLGIAQAGGGDMLAARKSFTAAGRLTPDNPLPLVMLVRANLAMKDVDSAKAALREIGLRFRDNSEIHATLARYLSENQQPELALAEALRAHDSAMKDPETGIALAVLENSAGAYLDAFRNAKAIVDEQTLPAPARAAAAGVAALSSESLGKRQEAISYLRLSLTLDTQRENSYLSLAFLYEKALDYRTAVEVLESGVKHLPRSTALLPVLGTDLIRAQKYAAGITILKKAIEAEPDNGESYLHLADGYRQLTNAAGEIETLRALAKRQADYPMIHILLARAILSASEPDASAALSELQDAEKRNPNDPQIFYLRGKACNVLGDSGNAEQALRRAIDLAPGDSGPYYQLARLYQKMGKQELAREMFQRTTALQRNER